jgi:hypothetical protein
MVSIIEAKMAEQEVFLNRFRRLYLKSLCAEMGFPVDLRDMALREASAMIELARDLTFPPATPAK